MRFKFLFLIFAALAFAGCSTTGPGAACDPCATEEVSPSAEATGPLGQAAAASARGGQEASNQPVQSDPGARGVFTPISRGAGSQTATNTTNESRSQAGAPSVNQGVVLPTAADARTGGGVSPVVATLQGVVDDLRTQLKLAIMENNADKEARLTAALDRAISQMAQAQASAQAQTVNNYHLENSVITQTVANGSASGDGQNAIDPANAKSLAEGMPQVVDAAGRAKAAGAQPDRSVTPEFPAPAPAPEQPK